MDKNEIKKRLTVLAGQSDLNEEEVKEMEGLNKQLSAIKAKEDTAKLLAKQAEDEEKAREEETEQKIMAAVKAERERLEAANNRLPDGTAPYQAQYSETWKYDALDGAELSLVIETLQSAGKPVGRGALKAMALRVGEMKDDNTDEGRKAVAYVKGAFKAATNINPDMDSIEKSFKAATDPMYSTGSGIGDSWVGTAYSAEIWRAIRAANPIVERIPERIVPDGYSSLYVPLESSDPTWYKVAEASASDATLKVPAATITASQAATANKQVTLGKIGARVLYTQELTEDSLVNFAPQLREQLQASGAEMLEHIVVNGDTELSANKNINDIAGTPAAGDIFLLFDGFRKLALVTNTANSRSASGGLVIEDYIDTLKLMGTAGLAGSDLRKVAFIVDPNVHYANMKLPEVKSRDVHSSATIENGFLKMAYGVDVIPSWQMHRGASDRKANTAGKVDLDTTSNNSTGSILAVRFDQWVKAFKRRMTMETTRIANADAWEIVALVRFGLAYRDNEASAISYNVGV